MKKYHVYDNGVLIGDFSALEISEKLGCSRKIIWNNSDTEYKFQNRYSFVTVDDENLDELYIKWDEYRLKILNAKPKITRTYVKVPFKIWKENPSTKNVKSKLTK